MFTPEYPARSDAAPYPSSDAVASAEQSAAALRAGVEVPPTEAVGRGVLLALLAVPVGVAATVLVWQLGFIASITSFAIAAGASYLYVRGAGTAPRAGLVPLILVILTGVVLSFLAVVAADAVAYYNTPEGAELGWPSATSFVLAHLFDPSVLGSYGSELAMFGVFAVLGTFGTLRRLLAGRRS
ncbi:MAG TPA: hypothetical protein VIB11_00075 [Pedococcus sp.]|jgi:hypothetical protein|uniref:hypothetical protein n=1 Tax=Pedococcus sp. TaxID=2860345 RepID=UPI002F933F3A